MLADIARGKRDSIKRLLHKCPDNIPHSSILPLFTVERGIITAIADQKRFDELVRYAGKPFDGESRLTASLSGHSHRRSVGGGMIVHRNAHNPHPEVILVDSEGAFQLGRPAPSACLIIENLANFLQFEDTLEFCRDVCGLEHDITDIDVIFGSGGQVTNQIYTSFWRTYSNVYVLPDADLGGLHICKTLQARVAGHTRIAVLFPSDLKARLTENGTTLTAKERAKLVPLSTISGGIGKIAHCLLATDKKLEQESYLVK